MAWTSADRNYNGVQFKTLRQQIDTKFNDIHDELSDCYYNNKPFKTYGILTKKQFEELHSLIFELYEVRFHNANMELPIAQRYPESEYRYVLQPDSTMLDKISLAQESILEKKSRGIELTI